MDQGAQAPGEGAGAGQVAGVDGAVVAGKVRESDDKTFGFNAQTEEYGDMFKFGVIDPAKVELSTWAAILISALSLGIGWVIYDRLCKSRLGENPTTLMLLLGLGVALPVLRRRRG